MTQVNLPLNMIPEIVAFDLLCDDASLQREAVVDYLRSRDVIAMVDARSDATRLSLTAMASQSGQLVSFDGEEAYLGISAAELAASLSHRFEAQVLSGGSVFVGGTVDEDAEVTVVLSEDSPTVALTRAKMVDLPLLVSDFAVPCTAQNLEDWRLLAASESIVLDESTMFLKGDLPIILLDRSRGFRALSIYVHQFNGSALPIASQAHRVCTFSSDDLDDEANLVVAMLHDDGLADVVEIIKGKPQLDWLEVLPEVVALPDDELYFTRALELLGLPTIAADVFEGRAELSESVEIEPTGLSGKIRQSINLDDSKMAAASRSPAVIIGSMIVESLIAAALLVWFVASDDRRWWVVVAGVIGVLLVLDVAVDGFRLRRIVRNRKSSSPA